MSKSDQFLDAVLSKTNSGKIKWSGYSAKVGNFSLSLFTDEFDRPELTVRTVSGTRNFDGPIVNELYKEVDRLAIIDDSDLLGDIQNL